MEFEKKLKEVEEAMKKLESGELKLEEAIEVYTNAIKNCNDCAKYLSQAKGKIEILTEQNNEENIDKDKKND